MNGTRSSALFAWWLLVQVPLPASAAESLFSPGPLSKAHSKIDDVQHCTQCHGQSQAVSPALCLKCHGEIQQSISQQRGLHGLLSGEARACDKCHQEHLGEDHVLSPMPENANTFDHTKVGFSLMGAHAKVACEACHDNAHLVDATVADLVADNPKHKTYMGLSVACRSCHFDEHRGQEPMACQSCHNESAWSPAPRFDHDKTDYPLTGKHRVVACNGCHTRLPETGAPQDSWPAPKSTSFTLYKGIQHAACTDCHDDPHKGAFGSRCTACHTTDSWKTMIGKVVDTSFHDKARFPLVGAHKIVPCRACHGPSPGKPAVFHNMAFQTCADCHADAHLGKLSRPGQAPPPCDTCHTMEGFDPTTYDVEAHKKARYPLEGAHAAVACGACHKSDPSLPARAPQKVVTELKRESRPRLFSDFPMDISKPLTRCDGCHHDVHGGQFAKRTAVAGCTDCHTVESFSQIHFDHNAETTFPLTGTHAQVACNSCHVQAPGSRKLVVYAAAPHKCATCHSDVHLGQFGPNTPCNKCHSTTRFNELTFNHDDPNFTHYPLDGEHAAVPCDDCHPSIPVGKNRQAHLYRPMPQTCDACHADFHRGAFTALAAKGRDATSPHIDCSECHNVAGWLPAAFAAHDATDFQLHGAHQKTPCLACHAHSFDEPVTTLCSGCHRDIHQNEFGAFCGSCHTEDSWLGAFRVEAHRMTNFPLLGAHASIPCEQCHPGAFDRNYRGTSLACLSCHTADYAKADSLSVSHTASGFGDNCQACHNSWSFAQATFAEHEVCFQIDGGPHEGIACLTCHTSLVGTAASGTCLTNTAACSSCHTHNCGSMNAVHTNVQGYQCADRKCYQCHMFAGPP